MYSGNYYLRSDWGEEANLLHFHCGTVGAGHGHSDKLHIDLVIQGEDVLMDGAAIMSIYPGARSVLHLKIPLHIIQFW